MKIFSDYFDVFPRIVPADQVSEIRITPRAAHAQLPPVENIEIRGGLTRRRHVPPPRGQPRGAPP